MPDLWHEAPFPNHETVVVSMANPDMVCHLNRFDCGIEGPHHIDSCGAFKGIDDA